MFYRVHGSGQARKGSGHLARGVQKQEMGLQLVGVSPGTDYVQIFGTMRWSSQVPYCKGRPLPVQEYVSIGECGIPGTSDKVSTINIILK